MKGWSSHLRSHPPNMWSKTPLQTHSEIMQSKGGSALLVKRIAWPNANDLQYAQKSPSLTSHRNRRSLLWKMSQGNGVVESPLQHPATQGYPTSGITLWLKEVALALIQEMWSMKKNPSRGLSRRWRNPKQEFPRQFLLNNKRMHNVWMDNEINNP